VKIIIPGNPDNCCITLEEISDYIVFNTAVNKKDPVTAVPILFNGSGAYLGYEVILIRIVELVLIPSGSSLPSIVPFSLILLVSALVSIPKLRGHCFF
jgi:hypothetical protein